jgi:hypothetical protein
MSRKLPDYSLLETFYPAKLSAEMVKQSIGGDVNQAHYKNTCIIRISQPLNYAGHLIPRDSEPFRTKLGKDKKWYGLRVDEFWNYMLRTYGKPTVHARREKGKPIDVAKFSGIRGIIGFRLMFKNATGHFTLWDGSHLPYDGDYPSYFANASEAALWEAGTTRVMMAPV